MRAFALSPSMRDEHLPSVLLPPLPASHHGACALCALLFSPRLKADAATSPPWACACCRGPAPGGLVALDTAPKLGLALPPKLPAAAIPAGLANPKPPPPPPPNGDTLPPPPPNEKALPAAFTAPKAPPPSPPVPPLSAVPPLKPSGLPTPPELPSTAAAWAAFPPGGCAAPIPAEKRVNVR